MNSEQPRHTGQRLITIQGLIDSAISPSVALAPPKEGNTHEHLKKMQLANPFHGRRPISAPDWQRR